MEVIIYTYNGASPCLYGDCGECRKLTNAIVVTNRTLDAELARRALDHGDARMTPDQIAALLTDNLDVEAPNPVSVSMAELERLLQRGPHHTDKHTGGVAPEPCLCLIGGGRSPFCPMHGNPLVLRSFR